MLLNQSSHTINLLFLVPAWSFDEKISTFNDNVKLKNK